MWQQEQEGKLHEGARPDVGADVWEVDRLVDRRRGRGGRMEYLVSAERRVEPQAPSQIRGRSCRRLLTRLGPQFPRRRKWQGWEDKFNSWEPAKNIMDDEMIAKLEVELLARAAAAPEGGGRGDEDDDEDQIVVEDGEAEAEGAERKAGGAKRKGQPGRGRPGKRAKQRAPEPEAAAGATGAAEEAEAEGCEEVGLGGVVGGFDPEKGYDVCGIFGCLLQANHAGPCLRDEVMRPASYNSPAPQPS